ncbi:MAG: hypothetical protein ACOX6H_04010 [Christensenellales bacterium]|jgi:hypothetical protein
MEELDRLTLKAKGLGMYLTHVVQDYAKHYGRVFSHDEVQDIYLTLCGQFYNHFLDNPDQEEYKFATSKRENYNTAIFDGLEYKNKFLMQYLPEYLLFDLQANAAFDVSVYIPEGRVAVKIASLTYTGEKLMYEVYKTLWPHDAEGPIESLIDYLLTYENKRNKNRENHLN